MNRERRTHAQRVATAERALLTAAIELISEQGYVRTTAAQIGERAGYSRSIVRLRYGSKEALLFSLLGEEYRLRDLLDRRENALGMDQVLAKLEQTRAALAANPALIRVLNVLKFESATQVEETADGVPTWADRHRQVAAALAEGQRDGSVRVDLDPEREARRFMAYRAGVAFRWMAHRNDAKFDAELREWGEECRREWQPPR